MKPRTLLILLFILVICGLIVGLSRTNLFQYKLTKPQDHRVFKNSVANPVKLTISDSHGMELIFHQESGSWEMIPPMRVAIKKDRLMKIIRMMDKLEYNRAFLPEDEGGLADSLTGLDKPNWTVVLSGEDGKTATLFVGKETPRVGVGKPETYVRSGDSQKTCIVALDISEMLTGDADDFRDMTVLKHDPKKFLMLRVEGRESFVLANGDEKLKSYDGRWRIVQPLPGSCDPAQIQSLIPKMVNIQAERFLDAGPGGVDFVKFGLDSPQLVIEFVGEEKNTLKLGNRRGGSISATVNDIIFFTLPVEMLDELQPPLDDLRRKILLPFNPDQVERIVIERPQKKMELVKISTGWKITTPKPGDVDQEKPLKFLNGISRLRAERWITSPDGEPIEIMDPEMIITLTLKTQDKAELLTLRIGKFVDSDKSIFCRSSANETVTTVTSKNLEFVMKSEKMFLQNNPITQPDKK